MLFHLIAALACFAAALLQFAVHRSPDCYEPPKVKYARRITVMALLTAGAAIVDGVFWGESNSLFSLFAGLISLGQILYAAHCLELGEPTYGSHA